MWPSNKFVALSTGVLLCCALLYESPTSAGTARAPLGDAPSGGRVDAGGGRRADRGNEAAERSDVNNSQGQRSPSFVGVDNGRAFIWDENSGVVQHLRTSMPVFKAFGISPGRNALLYSPLKNRIPSGELFLENLGDGEATKITDDLVMEAEFSHDEASVAYTFATGGGFGLAVVAIETRQQRNLVYENVLPDFIQWNASGSEIYYFETTSELNNVGASPRKVSADKGKTTKMAQDELPPTLPQLSPASDQLDSSSKEFSLTHAEVRYPFEIISPDQTKRVCGGNFFGSTFLRQCEDQDAFNRPHLAEGKLLKVTNRGIIVRSVEEDKTTTDFVDWEGNREQIGVSAVVSYNLPLSTFTLTQGGTSYPSPGNCNISSHTGNLRYAYDMQSQTIGKHVMSAAEGLVIYVVENINCNSCDTAGCGSPACPSGGGNGGWGNTVIIQHSDGTWTKYAHLQYNSVLVSFNTSACQGLYLGNQGHTGCSAGNFNGCGDHLHFQRQIGSDRDSASQPITFSDVSSNPLACLSSYTSKSAEVSACSTCRNDTATLRNRDGGPPIHPPGSLFKTSSADTVYLIDSDNRRRAITSPSVLAQLYNQTTDARTSTNFTNWVITVGQDELDLYEQGGNLSAALPGNGKPFPDGKLIGYGGEVSIVTGGGRRRAFTSGSRFTGLGYDFCQVVNVSQAEYNSYPAGSPVDAMPLLTSSLNISPAGPYTVGQNVTGSFSVKNVGYEPLPFTSLGVGGRFGTAIYDMNFISTTLAAGSTYNYISQPRQLNSGGTYDFFAAYQENNGHWALSIPANSGVIRSRQITTSQSYTITVSASPSAGGTVAGGGTFAAGNSRTVTATANSGYTFSNWTENGNVVSTSASYTFTLNSNRTLVANFSLVNYTISLSASPTASGTVSGGGTFAAGSSRTVTATPNNGYTFSNWTEGGSVVSSSASYNFTLNSNRNLVANFAVNPVSYTLSVNASPSAGGTVSGGGTFAAGTSVTAVASANSGYSFVNWTEGGSVVGSSASYTFTLNSNRNLVANFSQVSAPLTPPILISPGTATAPGSSVATLTPTFTWEPVSGADGYALYVSRFNGSTYDLIFDSQADVGRPLTGTSYVLPSGRLQDGGQYRWNMSTHNSAGYGTPNTTRNYFYVGLPPQNYTITVSMSPGDGGTVVGGGTFAAGSSRTVTATANSGYSFLNWTENGSVVSSSASYTFSLNSNRNLVANFAISPSTVQFSQTSYRASEAVGNVLIAVTRTGGGVINIGFATGNGTAVAGTDYTAVSGQLTFAASETQKTISIPIIDDTAVENDETLTVTLSNPGGGATIGSISSTTITIVDNEAAQGSFFRLESSAITISEGMGRAEVRVMREGDLSSSASVTFQTIDDPEAVPCATLNGKAYARCDYATTIERFTWAAWDSQPKSVAIPLIDDSRAEGTETLQVTLSSPQGGVIREVGTATITVLDNETAEGFNPISGNQFFVRMQYLDFLSREPEAGEPWTGVLLRCPDVNNTDPYSPSALCDRVIVSQSFFQSLEFQLKGFYTYLFYRVAFNRRPSYEEIIPDMRSVTDQTPQEVFVKRAEFAAAFTRRFEFTQLYGQMTNQQYVDALLGRYGTQQITTENPANFDGTEQVTLTRQQLVNVLNANSLSRAQVLRAVVQSNEADMVEYHGAFISMQYYGYLRRTPEEDGYQAWLRVINQDPNNIRLMVNGFMNSPEYKLRFGNPNQ
ncbi:MAG TPA: Calx-beta domain-containing protein [Pyrinomonadaceae bacterium]|nr:Calx-beta domain-containing protein [Pyrinomonadaceae bacterium]